MTSARDRLGAVAIVPFLLAAWQVVPLLLSPVSQSVAVIVLASAALTTSVGGVLAVVALAPRVRDPLPGTPPQPQLQPRQHARGIDRRLGWVVVLLGASPTAVLIAAVALSDDLLLWVGVGIQIVIIVGVQVGLVTLAGRNQSRSRSMPPPIT